MPQRPLPWCEGPKLAPFQYDNSTDQDIALLGHLGGGLHSEVFRARVQGKVYALKVFRFWRAIELICSDYFQYGTLSPDDVLNYRDPFNCECRAYGRLKEVGREDLAVRCYGYLMINKELEAQLTSLSYHDWNRDKRFKNRPLRCIVKELLPVGAAPSSYELLPKMRQDLLDLHAYGIVVWDLHGDNYVQGQIVDFSQAKTVPHIELFWNSKIFSRESVVEDCARDYCGFDGVVEDWNEANPEQIYWNKFLPSTRFRRRLRERSRCRMPFWLWEGVRLDAVFYDWKNKQPWKAKIGNLAHIYQKRGQKTTEWRKSYELEVVKRPVKAPKKRAALQEGDLGK